MMVYDVDDYCEALGLRLGNVARSGARGASCQTGTRLGWLQAHRARQSWIPRGAHPTTCQVSGTVICKHKASGLDRFSKRWERQGALGTAAGRPVCDPPSTHLRDKDEAYPHCLPTVALRKGLLNLLQDLPLVSRYRQMAF